MKNNLFICRVATQYENVGDMLICRTLLDLISKKGCVYIADDHIVPEVYMRELLAGIDNIRFGSAQGKARRFSLRNFVLTNAVAGQRNKIHVVEIPGHLFQGPGKITLKQRKALLLRKAYKLLGVRYVRIGFSLGTMSNVAMKYFSKMYNEFHLVGIRDSASLQMAVDHGFRDVLFTPDLAWAYDVKKHHPALAGVRRAGNKAVVSIRGTVVGRGRNEDYIASLSEAVYKLAERESGIDYVLSYQVDFDRDINKDLRERIKGHASVEFRDGTLTLDEALKLYASAGVVISNRLHVLLVAILAGSIPVALTDLETHAKITDLFRDNGLDEYLVDVAEPETLARKVGEIMRGDPMPRIEKLAAVVSTNREKLRKILDEYFPS